MNWTRLFFGLILGVFAGLLGAVIHGGFFDLPILGLILASAFVSAGALWLIKLEYIESWLAYSFAVIAVTLVLFVFPISDDVVVLVDGWPSIAWLLLSALAALGPGALIKSQKK